MTSLIVRGQVQTGQTALDHGITDLLAVSQNGQVTVYATSGQNGGLTAYELHPTATATVIDTAYFNAVWAGGAVDHLARVDTAAGPRLVVAGNGANQLTGYALGSDGQINAVVQFAGLNAATAQVAGLAQTTANTLFVSHTGSGGFQGYALQPNGTLSLQHVVPDTATTYAASVFDLQSVTVGAHDYLLTICQQERGVTAYRMTAGGPVATSSLGVTEGLALMVPTAVEIAQHGGRSFVLITSGPGDAAGQSGGITVLEVLASGALVSTDHVIDTLHTRFGRVQAIETVEANGRTYVLAGGVDDGITLFILLPNGRLHLLAVLEDSFAIGLENVSAIAAVDMGGHVHVAVASEISGGITELTFDVSGNGGVFVVGPGGGTHQGTAANDILIGGAGDDLLIGNAGSDIIEDGAGIDTLNGGNGADVFILRADGSHDLIADFEMGIDRLDLSSWPMMYDPSQLQITPTLTGAIINWRGEQLQLITRNGQSLDPSQVIQSVLQTPQRLPDFGAVTGGAQDQWLEGDFTNNILIAGAGNDTLFGYGGNDDLQGLAGNDMLDGGDGQDMLQGGAGDDTILGGNSDDLILGGLNNDSLDGGDGRDTILGDAGFDTIDGGAGADVIDGGPQADLLRGGDGPDHLTGGQGFDLLYGDGGNDTLIGGDDPDRLYGGDGNDLLRGGSNFSETRDGLYGEAGDDTLFGDGGFDHLDGGDGNDELHGGHQADNLYGRAGNDVMYGGPGLDRLFGGAGDDWGSGGDGNDGLFGEAGDDTLFGDAGTDRFFGGSGNDWIDGGTDDDTIYAGSGFDTIIGGPGNDLLQGDFNADVFVFADGHGRDTITDFDATNGFEKLDLQGVSTIADIGQFMAAAVQQGTDVRVITGLESWIDLHNVQLADLDPSDLLF